MTRGSSQRTQENQTGLRDATTRSTRHQPARLLVVRPPPPRRLQTRGRWHRVDEAFLVGAEAWSTALDWRSWPRRRILPEVSGTPGLKDGSGKAVLALQTRTVETTH